MFGHLLNNTSQRHSVDDGLVTTPTSDAQKIMAVAAAGDKITHKILRITPEKRKLFNCTWLRRPLSRHIINRTNSWQVLVVDDSSPAAPPPCRVLVHSAFYDSRLNSYDENLVTVRVLGVASCLAEQPIYCHLWLTGVTIPLAVTARTIKIGNSYQIGDTNYDQLMWTCPLYGHVRESDSPPSHVSLAARPCRQSTTLLPVVIPSGDGLKNEQQYQFQLGVCVPTSFWVIEPAPLVEWFEVSKMFGIAEINVYNCCISSRVEEVFDHYIKDGMLNLRQLPAPVSDLSWESMKLSSLISLNDCLYRNMYRYK